MNLSKKLFLAATLTVTSLCSGLFAADHMANMDNVMKKDGKMMVTKDGNTMAMTEDMMLTDGTKVTMDGTVTTADGKHKSMLQDGEAIGMDGKPMKSDGMAKKDHMKGDKMMSSVMMKDGKMMVMKDGSTMAMTEDMTLKNGTKVMMDGTVMMKDGTKSMMKDGDSISMSGKMSKSGM